MNTEQFDLSEILMDKRFELGLPFGEVASIIGVTQQEYLDLEYGLPHIPLSTYHAPIDSITSYERKLDPSHRLGSDDSEGVKFLLRAVLHLFSGAIRA